MLGAQPHLQHTAATQVGRSLGRFRYGSTGAAFVDIALNETPLLRQVVHESLRLFPPSPIVAPRRCVAARKGDSVYLRGYAIPDGALVLVSAYNIHLDHSYWGSDANAFNPSRRFEAAAWLPFSIGTRFCPGMHFALDAMHLVLARVLQRFRFTLTAPYNGAVAGGLTSFRASANLDVTMRGD